MYANDNSRIRINSTFSDDFKIQVGVHQDSVLSALLFIIVNMKSSSRDFRTGCPLELLYADDLVLVLDSLDNLLEKLHCSRSGLRTKGYE